MAAPERRAQRGPRQRPSPARVRPAPLALSVPLAVGHERLSAGVQSRCFPSGFFLLRLDGHPCHLNAPVRAMGHHRRRLRRWPQASRQPFLQPWSPTPTFHRQALQHEPSLGPSSFVCFSPSRGQRQPCPSLSSWSSRASGRAVSLCARSSRLRCRWPRVAQAGAHAAPRLENKAAQRPVLSWLNRVGGESRAVGRQSSAGNHRTAAAVLLALF
jgi:hypothetical protein